MCLKTNIALPVAASTGTKKKASSIELHGLIARQALLKTKALLRNTPTLYDRKNRTARQLTIKHALLTLRHDHFHLILQAQLGFFQRDFQG